LGANKTASGGAGRLAVTRELARSQTVTATDTATATITGSQMVTVNAGAATHYTVTGLTTAAAGTLQSATVTAQDQFGNTATGYRSEERRVGKEGAAGLGANKRQTN